MSSRSEEIRHLCFISNCKGKVFSVSSSLIVKCSYTLYCCEKIPIYFSWVRVFIIEKNVNMLNAYSLSIGMITWFISFFFFPINMMSKLIFKCQANIAFLGLIPFDDCVLSFLYIAGFD